MLASKNLSNLSNFPICLAPMVGLSHVATRLLIRRYMPKGARTIWPTEMLNSRRISNNDAVNSNFLQKTDAEIDLVPQILGNDKIPIENAVRVLKKWGAIGIDINMGCPVSKALKHNYGVALMGDAEYASQVVRYTVEASDLPVSVKLRAGQQKDIDFLLKFANGLVNAGASWLTLHPRTGEQKRRGKADWEQIRILKQNVDVPVIGNGDIQTSDDIFDMLESTNCDSVMVGRALCARPWLLWQVGEKLGFDSPFDDRPSAPKNSIEEGSEYGKALLFLLDEIEKYFKESLGLRKLNFYLRHTHMWLTYGHSLQSKILNANSYSHARNIIQDFFSRPQSMIQKTQLRI